MKYPFFLLVSLSFLFSSEIVHHVYKGESIALAYSDCSFSIINNKFYKGYHNDDDIVSSFFYDLEPIITIRKERSTVYIYKGESESKSQILFTIFNNYVYRGKNTNNQETALFKFVDEYMYELENGKKVIRIRPTGSKDKYKFTAIEYIEKKETIDYVLGPRILFKTKPDEETILTKPQIIGCLYAFGFLS